MPQKTRVLECIRQGQIGGGESHLLSLVENLNKNEFDPVVLSFTDGPMIGRLQQMGVPVHIIPTTRPFDISKWKEVKRFIRAQEVDLVHAHGTRANSNVLWASKSLGLPVVYTVHGWSFHPDQNALVRRVRILGEQYLTARSDVNISVSASNQQTGKDYMPSFRSLVINNGIDLQKFDPSRSFRHVRRELGLPEDQLLVLFLARFTSHKQPLALIRGFAKALPQMPNMHLLMVGDGDQKEEAKKLIAEHALADRITLVPFRQDVPDVLASADLYVLPSLWEGLPIGLLEAMAMGKTILASKVDGTSEIIRHGENGFLVDTQNLPDKLAAALIELGQNPERREAYGRAAMQTVSERFNAAHMTRAIESVYRKILGKPEPRQKTGPAGTLA